MKIFFDTEFTGLHAKTSLISIGLIAESGRTFYAEFTDFDSSQIDEWLQANVLDNCSMCTVPDSEEAGEYCHFESTGGSVTACHRKEIIAAELREWLESFDETVVMVSDCLAYDWVLFCDLWGHAFKVPKCVYYIPVDICGIMHAKGVDMDINREEYSGMNGAKHNALHDAKAIKACYEKLMGGK
jgi:hypothetical protein